MPSALSSDATPAICLDPPSSKKQPLLTKLMFSPPNREKVDVIDFTTAAGVSAYQEYLKRDVAHSVAVHDIRGEEENYTFERNGFQYLQHDVEQLKTCTTPEQITKLLIPETEALVRRFTGATKTILIAHRIRSLAQDERKGADNAAPAHRVHSDFTPAGARHVLEAKLSSPAELEKTLEGRVLFVNVWRPLKTITKDPLAVCDWMTVEPATNLSGTRLIMSNDWSELGEVSYSEKQKWYYLRGQRADEPVLFKQWDSSAQDGATLPHSAFVDPEFAVDEARESIEIKFIAVLPR